jgi:hypothetical protein
MEAGALQTISAMVSRIYVVTLRRRFFSDVFTAEMLSFHSITISEDNTSKTKRQRRVTT